MEPKTKIIQTSSIAIISSCTEDWGGSEELWGRSVPFLIAMGLKVTLYKTSINRDHPEFIKLAKLGVLFRNIDEHRSFIVRNSIRLFNKFSNVKGGNSFISFIYNPWVNSLIKILKKDKPEFALISQGINFDGLGYGYACSSLNIPYALIAQKAVDFYWPGKDDRPLMTQILTNAKACYFVSKHNLRLTEEQFGRRLKNGHVIFNPLKVGKVQPYPDTKNGIRLACVGRLFVLDKGQDILIRILSTPKWRKRPVSITFAGTGVDETALKEMADLLGVDQVSFAGQVENMDIFWQQFHALVLPSRSEGLPLSMVEAMAAGRLVIISEAGGNTELLEEDVTAFIGYPNEQSFEAAMDRAWNSLGKWEEMGKEAANQIALRLPASPEKDFVDHLSSFFNDDVKKSGK